MVLSVARLKRGYGVASGLFSLPLVSVVVPVYNGERYLRESLDSILAQTYSRTEVLVIDDASTDGTSDIIASYGDRVRCHRQSRNRGGFGNTNDGISVARGEYVAVYHADDVYLPTIVEREVEFLRRHPETGAVFCQDVFIDPFGREYGRLELPPELRGSRPLEYSVIFNALLTYRNSFFRCPCSMVRASVYRDVGTYRDEMFLGASDLDMWLRIARRYPVGILEEYLFRYRHGHDSVSLRNQHLRTDPERYFQIMDLYLEDGGRAMATPRALAAYEAHRAEERLMRVINHYILDQCEHSRAILRLVHANQILGSPRVQRGRLLVLFLVLKILARLPRIRPIANLFYQHWHATSASGLWQSAQREI
jgi:glycosyltransferase involved in cell wall biosynthesis